jgi:hypothetical protein
MPLRREVQFLRQRAKRMHEIAAIDPNSPLTPQLLDMAADLEERALDLEQAGIKRREQRPRP